MIIREDNVAAPLSPESLPTPETTTPTPPPRKGVQTPPQRLGELRPDLELFRGDRNEFGEATWVIFDPVADTYFRITDEDYRIIRLWTGNPEPQAFVAKLANAGLRVAPERLLLLSAFMYQNGLLRPGYRTSEERCMKMREMRKKMFWHMMLNYYLFFRIPLWSPDRFICRTRDVVETVFNRWVLAALRVLAGIGYLCLIVNWYRFTDAFLNSISLQGMIRYSIAVMVIKVIHEFSHAYTARHFGCRVRRMGVAFIFFFPRLYTDLTDSWRVRDRYRRFLIDGAGIFSELIIGGIAALVWTNTGPGLTHAVSYYIFAVSIINTVLINGNPFIRYDGYYMLMDLVNIDNLQKRGTIVVRNLWRHYLFGLPAEPDPSRGWKRAFLIAYGFGMFFYRIFLYLSIILLVYFNFAKAVGIVLLILEVYLMILKPIMGEGKALFMNRKRMNRRKALLSLSGAALIIALLAVPLPWRIAAPCEVAAPGAVMIYAPENGIAVQLPPEDGSRVTAGDLLLLQENPQLDWRLQEADVGIALDSEQLDQAERSDQLLGQVAIIRESLESSRATREETLRRRELLATKAPLDGIFTRRDRHLTPGKRLNRGDLIGEIHPSQSPQITAYVSEEDVKFLRVGDTVSVELNGDLPSYPGKITSIREVTTLLSPSPLLDAFGGPILTTPIEENAFLPQTACYRVEVLLTDQTLPTGRSGTTRIRRYASIGGNLLRTVLRVLRRELSF